MIGAIISVHYVGKKPWLQAILFWFIYFILMMAISFSLLGILLIPFIGILLSVLVFCALAHYWLKFPWIMALKLFAVAFVIDILIAFILAFALVGFSFTNLMPGLETVGGQI